MKIDVRTPFIDLLFNLACVFACLFILAFIQINPIVTSDKNDESSSQFYATIEWDPDSADDIDMWLRAPNDEIVGFQIKDASIGFLEHDDRGTSGDIFIVDGKAVTVRENNEKIVVRYPYAGRYYINLHYYARRNDGPPMRVKVVLYDLVSHKTAAETEVFLEQKGQEVTALSFSFNEKRRIFDISKLEQVRFVATRYETGNGGVGE